MNPVEQVLREFAEDERRFHEAWTQVVGTPGYNKRAWVEEHAERLRMWRDKATAAGHPKDQPMVLSRSKL